MEYLLVPAMILACLAWVTDRTHQRISDVSMIVGALCVIVWSLWFAGVHV